MDAKTFETRNHPSRQLTEGPFDRHGATRHAAKQCPGVAVPSPDSGVPPFQRRRNGARGLQAICSRFAPNLKNMKLDQDQGVVYVICEPISAVGAGGGRQAGRANSDQIGELRTQARQVGSARKGEVTHAGGRAEIVCHAEI